MANNVVEEKGREAARQMSEEEALRKQRLEQIQQGTYSPNQDLKRQEIRDLESIAALPTPPEQTIIVPDVRGLPPKKAQAALEKLGFKTYITKEKSQEAKEPVVLTLLPTPGTAASMGDVITIVVQVPMLSPQEEDAEEERRAQEEELERERQEALEDMQNEEANVIPEYEPGSPEAIEAEEKAGQSRLQSLKEGAQYVAKEGAKRYAKTAVKGVAAEAAEGVIASTAPIWGTILAIILAIAAVIGLIVLLMYYVNTQCSTPGVKGAILRNFSWASEKLGFSADICVQLGYISENLQLTPQSTQVSTQLTDAQVWAQLQQYGIGRNAFPPQTDFNGMRQSTVDEVIWFKVNCATAAGGSCSVIMTGGTEPGHADGQCSHATGYKFDIDDNPGVDAWIMGSNPDKGGGMAPAGSRNVTEKRFVNPATGAIWVREATHWDVVVACEDGNVE